MKGLGARHPPAAWSWFLTPPPDLHAQLPACLVPPSSPARPSSQARARGAPAWGRELAVPLPGSCSDPTFLETCFLSPGLELLLTSLRQIVPHFMEEETE